MLRFLAFCLIVVTSFGCAHHRSHLDSTDTGVVADTEGGDASDDDSEDGSEVVTSGDVNPNEPLPVKDSAVASSIPDHDNELVQEWIEYFQNRGRPHMVRYLERSTRYIAMMKEIFKSEGLPEDLVYVSLIESGFNPHARSRARAVGAWQFIRGTARRYGLRMNSVMDERRDFVLSTRAAAKYLHGLYNLFGDWYLAIASYNVGENKVKRAVMNKFTRDFWELAEARQFPRETIHYVPKFLAARRIARDPAKYGFADIAYMPPLEYAEVPTEQPVNLRLLAKNLNMEIDDLRQLNPVFRTDYVPVLKGAPTLVRVPKSVESAVAEALVKSVSKQRIVAYEAEPVGGWYRIQSGDSLFTIAQRYGTSVAALREINDFSNRQILRPGQKIKIPSGRRQAAKARTVEPKRIIAGNRVHIVRRGDTLSRIARIYNVHVAELARSNNMAKRSKLFVGSRLVIPD